MSLPWLVLVVLLGQQPIAVRVATADFCKAIVDQERTDLGDRVLSARCFLVGSER